jgi:hypothetical protein
MQGVKTVVNHLSTYPGVFKRGICMFSKNSRKELAAVILILTILLIGGAMTEAGAFSVDVKNLYYYNPSPRGINNYDFSAGSVGGPIPSNNIGIPDSFVTKFGTDSGFRFGNIPVMGTTTVTLNTTAQVGTVTTTQGGAALQGASAGQPPPPATSWTYALALQNFSGVTDAAKEYKFEIGTAVPPPHGCRTAAANPGHVERVRNVDTASENI